ncbi:MAG: RNA-guided endonuclease InsQ/TnpB family protein [Parasutterella excrementihominis]
MSDRSGGIQLLIRRAFKFELKPNGMQIQLMKQFCGCARYVYNRTLSLEKSLYKKDSKHSFKYTEAANRLPEWKKKNPFLKECHSQVLQQSLKDLEQAYINFFRKRANFPKYKKKFQHDSIRFPQGVQLDEAKQQIRLPISGTPVVVKHFRIKFFFSLAKQDLFPYFFGCLGILFEVKCVCCCIQKRPIYQSLQAVSRTSIDSICLP